MYHGLPIVANHLYLNPIPPFPLNNLQHYLSTKCIFVRVRVPLILQIRTYDLRTAQLLTEDTVHPITSFSLNSDGSSISASCLDGVIRLWDRTPINKMDSRKKVFLKLHSSHTSGNYKLECSFTSDDKYLISGSECGAVVVYDAESRSKQQSKQKAAKLRRHTGPTCSVASCPHPSRPWLILSASYDGSAVVWASREESEHCLEE